MLFHVTSLWPIAVPLGSKPSNGSEKSGSSGTNIPTKAQTTMNTVHMPRTTTGQSAIRDA